MLLKQAANLLVFQKYFDQWDMVLKLVGERMLQYALYNWNAEKVAMMIGEEPSPHFYSRIFAKYKTVVEEGLETPTQRNLQAQQMLEINREFGREVIPASMIIKDMNLQGKTEIVEFLKNQEQQAQQMQQEETALAHAFEDAKLKELYSKATANLARAREDHSRSESNLGLYEERLSAIEKNRAMSLKDKQAALTSMLENMQRFGEIETEHQQLQLDIENQKIMQATELEKQDVERRTQSNKFVQEILGQATRPQTDEQTQQKSQMPSPNMGEMV
jgi:DNA-directed RNA polymerase beta subunit